MSRARAIRRLAFQVLFQLDAQGGKDVDAIGDSIETDLPAKVRHEAIELAKGAYSDREAADAAMEALAPTWPARRQPAVDRAILRLAHHEIVARRVNAKIVINEAVELAREFSTERSPAFINALLDRIMKASRGTPIEPPPPGDGPAEEPAS